MAALLPLAAVVHLARLVLMKLTNQLFTFNYQLFNANIYDAANGSCRYRSPSEIDAAPEDQVMLGMFRYSYLAVAIGGLLSSAYANRRLVLSVGGAVMTVASAGVFVVRVLDLACNRAAYILAWALYPVAMFLVLACLLAAFADFGDAGRRPRWRVSALVLYYLAASSTIWFNLGVWPLVNLGRDRGSHQLVAAASTAFGVVFVAASRHLRDPPPRLVAQFERPTMQRLLRYCLVFTVFTLYIVQQNDGHIYMYFKEALFYMHENATDRTGAAVVAAFRAWNVPRTVNIFGMLATSAALIGLCAVRARGCPASVDLRLYAGIGISTGTAATALACALAMHAAGAASVPPLAAAAAFSALAFAEGVSEILAMVAAYELMDEIAPPGHRDLLVGIALTVWYTASFVRCGMYSYAMPLVLPPGAMQRHGFCNTQFTDHHLGYCATHAADLLLSAACLAYARFVSLPLAATIRQAAPGDSNGDNDELDPLLTDNRQ